MPAGWLGNSVTKAARAKAGGGFESAVSLSAPGAPSFTVSKTSTSITATITDASGATSYESSVDGTNWFSGRTVTGLTAETAYTFQVRGINSAGTGPATSQAVTTNAATGDPSISSVTDNGDGTLSITGSNFGAKAQAAPILHDIGGNAYENGVLNTFYADQPDQTRPSVDLTYPNPSAPYVNFGDGTESFALIDKSSAFRQASQGCNYFFTGEKAFLGDPTVYQSGDGSRRLYWAAWVKYRYSHFIQAIKTTNRSGTFQIDEVVTVNGQDIGATYIGYSTSRDQYYIHTQTFNPLVTGDVFVGQTSGASMTSSSTLLAGGKISRIRSNYNNAPNETNFRGSDSFEKFYASTSDVEGSVYNYTDILPADIITNWTLIEYEIDAESDPTTMVWKYWINGESRGTVSTSVERDIDGITISIFGLDSSGRMSPQEMRVAETYMDKVLQRVYIGNAATWSAVTHRELQRPTVWAADAVTVAKNLGTLASGWVYVVGPDGAVNETGVAI